MSLPHIVGAPVAGGGSAVPEQLIRDFTIASLSSNAVFWLALGTAGGFMYRRSGARSSLRDTKRISVRQRDTTAAGNAAAGLAAGKD